MVKRLEKPQIHGSMTPSGNNAQLSKAEKGHGRNMENNTTGRHIQWKETNTIANFTTLRGNH